MAEEAGVEPTEDAYAPSNGFEARAPHRERYSSADYNAALRRATEEGYRPRPAWRFSFSWIIASTLAAPCLRHSVASAFGSSGSAA
jgi:hypothetical protein